MIRDHVRLDDTATRGTGDGTMNTCRDASLRLRASGDYTTKDRLYMKSLQDSLRMRALMASTQNATKFIPDEQLLSSAKRREAAEVANASRLVPLRRRDRLQELLLLEHKARLREEARLRAERRALGLPEDDDDVADDAPSPDVESAPGSAKDAETGSQKERVGSADAASTPSSRCSAEHELHATLRELKRIAARDPDTPAASQKPLSRDQIYELRKLVHEQSKKARAMAAASDHQPHLCNHCFSVNVQAKHLCPKMTGSVAFDQTGKVINPAEGTKFGTQQGRGADGTYGGAHNASLQGSQKLRLDRYNPHPSGTGVVFPPLHPATTTLEGQRRRLRQHPLVHTMFNNHIAPGESVEDGLQYPGSTYNVYDGSVRGTGEAVDELAHRAGSTDAKAEPQDAPSDARADELTATRADGVPAATTTTMTSSSLWRTTNQDREADMRRFIEFQKRMQSNAHKAYNAGPARREVAAPPTTA